MMRKTGRRGGSEKEKMAGSRAGRDVERSAEQLEVTRAARGTHTGRKGAPMTQSDDKTVLRR